MAEQMIVVLSNSGGELDRRAVAGSEEAARAAIDMIEQAGELYPLDSITIRYAE